MLILMLVLPFDAVTVDADVDADARVDATVLVQVLMVVLHSNITQDIFVTANTPLFSIISNQKKDEKYAKIITPTKGIGKITQGDKAVLKLDGYPYKEYGVIISEVHSIAPLPNEDQQGKKYYEIKIPLRDTLMTNYKKVIEYKPQSALTAEIITKDKSVLERMTEQLLDLITEK